MAILSVVSYYILTFKYKFFKYPERMWVARGLVSEKNPLHFNPQYVN